MAQRSDVPTFGIWEGENVQYTAFFENARKVRDPGAGRRKVTNPNDPQQNPYALLVPRREEGPRKEHHIVDTNRVENRSTSEFPPHGRVRMGPVIESSNDRMSPDHLYKQPAYQRRGSRASSAGSSYSHTSSPVHRNASRAASVQRTETHHRAASVPKFGSWNERDPSSVEGYTVIFDKVKEEKAGAPTKQPQIPEIPAIYRDDDNKKINTSTKFKRCFCLAA